MFYTTSSWDQANKQQILNFEFWNYRFFNEYLLWLIFQLANWEKKLCFGPTWSLFSFSTTQTEQNSREKNWGSKICCLVFWSHELVIGLKTTYLVKLSRLSTKLVAAAYVGSIPSTNANALLYNVLICSAGIPNRSAIW